MTSYIDINYKPQKEHHLTPLIKKSDWKRKTEKERKNRKLVDFQNIETTIVLINWLLVFVYKGRGCRLSANGYMRIIIIASMGNILVIIIAFIQYENETRYKTKCIQFHLNFNNNRKRLA